MLPMQYSHLNTIQKGAFGEAYSKMAFTLAAFEVYSAEYDDRGVDYVVRSPRGAFYSVQVKTTSGTANPFIYQPKFQKRDDFLFVAVQIDDGSSPRVYGARGTDWDGPMRCLNYNPSGGKSGPYYELRVGSKYADELDRLSFDHFAKLL